MSNQNKNKIIEDIFDEFEISGYDMLREILRKYKNHKCNSISAQETTEYKEIGQKLNTDVDNISSKINNGHIKNINIKENELIKNNSEMEKLTEEISKLTKSNESLILKMHEMESKYKKEIEDLKLELCKNKKEVQLPSPSKSKDIKNVDIIGNKNILPKISVFQNPDINWKERIAKKTFNSINNYHKLCSEINQDPNVNKETFIQIYDYIKKNNCYRSTYWRIKEKIKRSFDIYNIYKEKLMYVDFSLSKVSRLNKIDFNLWMKELDKVINNIS